MIRFICNQSLVIILFSRCENLPYLLGHFDLITNFLKYWFVQLFFEMSNIPRTGSVVFTDTLVNIMSKMSNIVIFRGTLEIEGSLTLNIVLNQSIEIKLEIHSNWL